jgi:hypothetical protein
VKAEDWTRSLQSELKKRGPKEGYDIISNQDVEIAERDAVLKVRPDVAWTKNGKLEIIFEIDQYSRDQYQKTIFGSMLQGLILAKQKSAKFVEIVPKNTENGRKAHVVSRILKEEFNDLPEFCVIQVRKSDKPSAVRHAKYDLKTQLDRLLRAKS